MIVGVQKTRNGVCLRLSRPSIGRGSGSLVAGTGTVNPTRSLCPEKPYDLGCRKHPQVAENAKIVEDSLYISQQPNGEMVHTNETAIVGCMCHCSKAVLDGPVTIADKRSDCPKPLLPFGIPLNAIKFFKKEL